MSNWLRAERWHWISLCGFMTCVGFYFIVRYAGLWAENDSTTFSNAIQVVERTGRLIPAEGTIYPNGFAFQSISVFLLALTGTDVARLQQLVYPLIAGIVVPPAWILFRELLGSRQGATLSTLLLFTQPEFLFVILRSSHEKFSRMFTLLCLYCIARSLLRSEPPSARVIYIPLFYLIAFALIATNNLLAHSFIAALACALALGWLLQRRLRDRQMHDQMAQQRLSYAVFTSLCLVYVVMFYVYPPALHDLRILYGLGQHVAALLLDFQTANGAETTNAYAQVAIGWTSLPTYFLVSIANWIILAASLAIWTRLGLRWLVFRTESPAPGLWLLWLLYAAFLLQGALSVVADASGVLIGNLQHRLFPSFSLVAVALVGSVLAQQQARWRTAHLRAALSLSLFCIAILSVFKATNEPLLSNKWTFYQADELTALDWIEAHHRHSEIWTEFDERLVVAYYTARGSSPNNNMLVVDQLRPATRSILVSDITALRSRQLGRVLPVPPDALRVYDNGSAQLYRLRPQTPFQP